MKKKIKNQPVPITAFGLKLVRAGQRMFRKGAIVTPKRCSHDGKPGKIKIVYYRRIKGKVKPFHICPICGAELSGLK
jgi:hypothetical protein